MEFFCIHIKESIYKGALDNRGDCLGFICHELCHFILIYLFEIKPIVDFNRDLNKEIPAYKSAEWQAKALCGEIMIPYDKCKNKTFKEIKFITKSSKEQIHFFLEKVVKK